jgi:alkanesulfonate monooxygenase SsuD/methylene tetrahydromethanopterin reductase-like flavin-dependent oxidoreductase (luciferase family)
MPSPQVALAAIAARTKRMKLGSAVALAPLHHPVRFAEDCAVLDILSEGRLEMALAIGYRRRETQAYGVEFTTRGRRFDEFLEIVRGLWAGETVTFEGQHYSVQDALIRPPAPRGRIPLYIGGFAEKALARVAKYADGYFGNEEVCAAYADKLRAEGKDPTAARIRIQGLFTVVAADPDKAMEELAPYYHYVNNTYGEWLSEDKAIGLDDPMLKPMSLEAFKQSGILQILTPGKAIDFFRAMQSRIPVEHYMMMLPAGLPPSRFVEYAELFAKEVIPAFR